MYGRWNKENSSGMWRKLWDQGNCITHEDGHAHILIMDYLQEKHNTSSVPPPPPPLFTSNTSQPISNAGICNVKSTLRGCAIQTPSVSPPPPPLLTRNVDQCNHSTEQCLRIASGKSGRVLSYIASSFRNSASQLNSMAYDKDFFGCDSRYHAANDFLTAELMSKFNVI